MADVLQQSYCGNYIKPDILRQMYYGRYSTADTLWQIHCVQQKRPYLDKCAVLEALDCCIRILSLQRLTAASPGTSQTALRRPWGAPREPTRPVCGNNA